MEQKQIFLESEGDAWFNRNQQALEKKIMLLTTKL
jgi:hypothetical protein